MKGEKQKKSKALKDRLSDLPDSILLNILSLLLKRDEIMRTCVLSTRWWSLWKSIPASLDFVCPRSIVEEDTASFVSSTTRELCRWRCCPKIQTLSFCLMFYRQHYVQNIDSWVRFAANIEGFTLEFSLESIPGYEFPQFAYENLFLKNLVLRNCILKPSGSVNWSHLVSFSISELELTEAVLEKVLSGCPNLECLEIDEFRGIHHLEISSEKLRKLILKDYREETERLEILVPYVQYLELSGRTNFILGCVASLVTVVLDLKPDIETEDREEELKKTSTYFKEILLSVAHVENVKLGSWSIELLSTMELKGWKSPPSSWKFLTLDTSLERVDFSGICHLLQSASNIETLLIDWFKHRPREIISDLADDDEERSWFENHSFKCSLPHLKTINIINIPARLSANKFVIALQYLLKNARVLEKLFIADCFKGSDYCKMAPELLNCPRSSPLASVVFRYP